MNTPTITSLQNPRVKNAVRLRSARGRAEQGRIVVDGVREISRAVSAGVELIEVYVCPDACGEDARELATAVASRSVKILTVTPAVFEKLAFGKRAEGLVAIARTPDTSLEDIDLRVERPIAVLEGVEKPGNVGAVLRSADAAGVNALVVADGRTDLYNPNAIRASLGAIFSLPVCSATSEQTLSWLRGHGVPIFAACVIGASCYTDVSFRGPCAIVLGSETKGLSHLWRADDITAVSLPMLGSVDSLNVSTAAAVLFYEAVRQRRAQLPEEIE